LDCIVVFYYGGGRTGNEQITMNKQSTYEASSLSRFIRRDGAFASNMGNPEMDTRKALEAPVPVVREDAY
jgi:hypothetical protein